MAAASLDPKAIGAAVRGHRVYHEVYAERAIGTTGRPVSTARRAPPAL